MSEKTKEQEALEQYIAQTQSVVEELIADCREKEARVEGFGVEYFNELAKAHNIPETIAEGARICIKDPSRVFTIRFIPNNGGQVWPPAKGR